MRNSRLTGVLFVTTVRVRLIIPRQPGTGVGKDFMAVFLHRHQILQGIHTRLHTGGNHTGEHTGDVRTMLRGIEEGVLVLADASFKARSATLLSRGAPGSFTTSRERVPMIQHV